MVLALIPLIHGVNGLVTSPSQARSSEPGTGWRASTDEEEKHMQ